MIKEKTQKQVAIQGSHGAFHEVAANNFFSESIHVLPCTTFEEITQLITSKQADYGLMAIENSVAGSLMPNYALLRDSFIKIVGEEYLHIEQNLLTLPGQSIQDITEVHSHYMAIAQTRKYFKKYPHIKLVEASDTAQVAKEIQENKIKGRGAIASELAAQLYQLEIMARGIETHKKNFTRFLVLAHQDNKDLSELNGASKASICFSLPHEKGSLSSILSILAIYDLNLTKIQSLPIIGKAFRYLFYVDVIFTDCQKFENGIAAIKPLVSGLEQLGTYKQAKDSLTSIHQQ